MTGCLHIVLLLRALRCLGLLLPIWLASPAVARDKGKDDPPVLYETSVYLVVQGIGGIEVPALVNEDTAYLSVADVFDFLKVKHSYSSMRDSLMGYFVAENNPYIIDMTGQRIHYQDKHFLLHQYDVIRSETGFYLRLEFFGSVFGLPSKFNFRNLSVHMNATVELPAVRELKRQQMRENMRQLRGELKADTVIKRSWPLFRFGMADWSVITNQRDPGGNDTWLNLRAGATVAGGEATVSLNYNNYAKQQGDDFKNSNIIKPFDHRQQYYRWRYVDNDQRALRQVVLGKIFIPTISSLFDPVVGVQVTNAPTTYRRSFGTYTLSNVTEPGWTVELYVNNALVDYTTADANGLYSFQVPLVYGNSQVRLRFYGPWGEERMLEENVSIPFSFLPKNEFEYTASAGYVEDSVHSFLTRAQGGYGVTKFLTMGAGVEYKSTIPGNNTIPFVTTSVRLANNLLLSGEYAHEVRGKGLLSWRLPANIQIDAEYTRYKKDQRAIIYNFREERKLSVAKPFFTKGMSIFSRFTFNQLISEYTRYSTTELLLSGAVGKVGVSVSNYAVWVRDTDPFIYSNVGLSLRLPGNLLVMPQVQYGYTDGKFISARCEVGRYIFRRGYLNVAYEENFRGGVRLFQAGLRWDFAFGQMGLSVLKGNKSTTGVASMRGSFVHEGKTGYTAFSNRSQVGTGGLLLCAFLDLNGNSKRDNGEPRVQGLRMSVNGGRLIPRLEDTAVLIMEMEPYARYVMDLGRSSFDNISWKIRNPIISVMAEPNQVKLVEVPVVVVGEVTGHVLFQDHDRRRGMGRIRVDFLREDGTVFTSVLSEQDGFYNFLGLPPGNYIVRPDPGQLKKLGLAAVPAQIPVQIDAGREGDVVDKVKFVLQRVSESAVRF
ncbi:hypothetical protein [Chitinophaga caseinilytica]|uniref:Carboxypeptidase regulatory-like domain-containing protein n=1 Tax=Chitinophaga caseinilytica TaxID=2267521 RepID=A0ABZ2Z6V3_9BACT